MGDGDEMVRLGTEHEDHRVVEQASAEDRPVLLVEGEQQGKRVAGCLQRPAEAERLRPRRVGTAPADAELGPNVFGNAADRVVAQLNRRLDARARLRLGLHGHGSES